MNDVTGMTRNGALLAIVGAAVAVIGVFMPWATVRFGGDEFLPGFTDSASGTGDWSGLLALIAALLVLAGAAAALMASEASGRRLGGWAAAFAGVAVIVFALIGYFRVERLVAEAGGVDLGFTLEELGLRAGSGVGIFITMLGGLVAAVGGFLAARSAADEGTPESPPAAPPDPPPAPS